MDSREQDRRHRRTGGPGRGRRGRRGSYLGRLVGSTFNSDDPSASPVSVQPGQDVTIEIPSGSTAEDIGAILAAQGVVRSALEFEVAVRNNEADARLQAGTYGMQTVMDPNEVVAMLVVGPVADVYRATVIEGLKVEEILTALAEASGVPYADFETALLSGDVETSLAQMPASRPWPAGKACSSRIPMSSPARPSRWTSCNGSPRRWSSGWGASTGPPWRLQG